MATRQGQGVGDGSGGDLQLHDEDGGGGDEIGGGVDVGRRDFGVGAGGDDDGVFAALVDEDDGAASGGAFGDGDVVGLDAMLAQGDEQALSEVVVSDATDEVDGVRRRGDPGGGDGLVGALATGDGEEVLAGEGFAGLGSAGAAADEVHADRAEDDDGLCVGMGWFYRRGAGGDTQNGGLKAEHPTLNIQHSTSNERQGFILRFARDSVRPASPGRIGRAWRGPCL